MHLQGAQVHAGAYPFILAGAVAAGMAAGGIPGPGPIVVLGLVLQPLGVPPEVGVASLMAVNALVDPFITALNVTGNCFAASTLAHRRALAAGPAPGLATR